MAKIYDFKAQTSRGKEIDFSQFQGKVLLVVNTASKCGFTPQFAGLEELNQKYKDKGLVIIGFPCNQFKEQDPADDSKSEDFCQLNYGVKFHLMSLSFSTLLLMALKSVLAALAFRPLYSSVGACVFRYSKMGWA